jgi:hypothetical protein
MDSTGGTQTSKKRISDVAPKVQPAPWVRAETMDRCFLYWLSTRSFPVPVDQRLWLLTFLDELTEALHQTNGLEPQQFLEPAKLPPATRMDLLSRSMEIHTLPGITRAMSTAGGPAESCSWFPGKEDRRQRDAFFGHGAMTILYVAADPAPPPPLPIPQQAKSFPMFAPIFEMFDIDQIFSYATTVRHPFLSKTKTLAGEKAKNDRATQGALFLLPTITSIDFFQQSADEVKRWFDVFSIYIRESRPDNGILLASKTDLNECLSALVQKMKAEGSEYRVD